MQSPTSKALTHPSYMRIVEYDRVRLLESSNNLFEHKNDSWPKQDHVASAMYMLMELKHDDIKATAIVGVVLKYETSIHRESPRYRPHPKATIWLVVDGNPVTC